MPNMCLRNKWTAKKLTKERGSEQNLKKVINFSTTCTLFFDNEIYLLIKLRAFWNILKLIVFVTVRISNSILVCLKIPVQPLAGVCWVYFITRKKWISKMLYHLVLLIIVFILSFATDARYMSPNLGPSTWHSSAPYYPLFPPLTPFCFYTFLFHPGVFGKGFEL